MKNPLNSDIATSQPPSSGSALLSVPPKTMSTTIGLVITLGLSACAPTTEQTSEELNNPVPVEAQILGFKHSAIEHRYLDGKNDDLLTAGLGLTGLQSHIPPRIVDPQKPTAAELRRLAIYTNYRAIVSTANSNGYGRLYGPDFHSSTPQQPVSGHEYHSSILNNDNSVAANIVIQIPDGFDRSAPCIVAAPSSGSRGVWGAIATAGDWGLRKSCAVVYTDKGTGTGFRYLDDGQGYNKQGILVDSLEGRPETSSDGKNDSDKKDFRVEVKHAHSGANPEKNWGNFTLQSVKMAFYVLNKHHAFNSKTDRTTKQKNIQEKFYTRTSTRVIASSISNGGNSVLKAAENDNAQWLDAVVASEPTISIDPEFSYQVESSRLPYEGRARNILENSNAFAQLLPCALLTKDYALPSVFSPALAAQQKQQTQRCENLSKAGRIKGSDTQALAQSALNKLQSMGLETNYNLQAFSAVSQIWESIAVNYSNAYGGFSVDDNLCGFQFTYQQQGVASSTPQEIRQKLYGLSSGISNTAGIALQYIDPVQEKPTPLDPYYAGLQCLADKYQETRIQTGLAEVRFDGDLQQKPTIILQGLNDSLVAANHNARAYMVYRNTKYPTRDNVRYYEVDKAQHFDALLGLPEFSNQLIPLHYYYEQALELMWRHLEHGSVLPPSQRIIPEAASAGKPATLPNIEAQAGAQAIHFKAGTMTAP